MDDRIISMAVRGWIVATGIAFAIFAGMSAHAALRAMSAHAAPAVIVQPTPTGFEVEDHFPGSALLYLADENAAPARGTTGTTELPDLPIPTSAAAFAMTDTGVQPAAPFSFGSASALDRGRALECLTAAIYYEAASEPDAGQQAVAQVVLNRVRHPAFPATVCGVVYQGSERASGCQFSFACDGAMARVAQRTAWLRALRVAAMALSGRVYAPVGLATHYHTYAVTPAWNRSLVMTDVVGAHFFHRWKGYWGTAMAFHQRYLGGEPVPGPHQSTVSSILAAAMPAIAHAAAAPAAIAPTATVLSTYTEAGAARAADAEAGDTLPPRSQILDKWKDSGSPLQ